MPILEIGQDKINYQLKREDDIYFVKIYLDDLNGICVTAPSKKQDENVEAFIVKKKKWIKEKWIKIHDDLYQTVQIETGARVPYLGRKYKLITENSTEHETYFTFQKGKFFFTYPASLSNEEIKNELNKQRDQWLQQKASEKFKQLHSNDIQSEDDHYRLGLKKEDGILLNWRLIQRSKPEIQSTIDDLIEEKTF